MKRMDKRGQEMALGTIITIVLGIAVLVFLIFGFSTGWNNLWSKVTSFGGTDNNVNTIVQACALRCSTGDTYGFCQEERTVKYGKGVKAWDGTAISEDVESSPGTCKDMTDSTKYPGVNVDSCPSLC
ncbi:hypothetical protein K8R30_03315 [archaeon]|nr:hypothetical protein [archaeon]